MTLTEWWSRTRYRLYAPVYDWLARPLDHGRRRAIERLDLDAGDQILILGTGPGLDPNYLPSPCRVTAVDAAPDVGLARCTGSAPADPPRPGGK